MKLNDYEAWVKDGHACLQMSSKQFNRDNGILKIDKRSVRWLLSKLNHKPTTTAQEICSAVMTLTLQRRALLDSLAQITNMGASELEQLFDDVASASDVPDAAVIALLSELEASNGVEERPVERGEVDQEPQAL